MHFEVKFYFHYQTLFNFNLFNCIIDKFKFSFFFTLIISFFELNDSFLIYLYYF